MAGFCCSQLGIHNYFLMEATTARASERQQLVLVGFNDRSSASIRCQPPHKLCPESRHSVQLKSFVVHSSCKLCVPCVPGSCKSRWSTEYGNCLNCPCSGHSSRSFVAVPCHPWPHLILISLLYFSLFWFE